MARDLTTTIGAVTLKNPIIAGPAEHMIDYNGISMPLIPVSGR